MYNQGGIIYEFVDNINIYLLWIFCIKHYKRSNFMCVLSVFNEHPINIHPIIIYISFKMVCILKSYIYGSNIYIEC